MTEPKVTSHSHLVKHVRGPFTQIQKVDGAHISVRGGDTVQMTFFVEGVDLVADLLESVQGKPGRAAVKETTTELVREDAAIISMSRASVEQLIRTLQKALRIDFSAETEETKDNGTDQ